MSNPDIPEGQAADSTLDGTQAPQPAPRTSDAGAGAGTPYVRAPRSRITQPAINDLAADDDLAASAYTHDSGYTTGRGLTSGRGYTRSRNDMRRLQKDLHYGQYLEIPKGRRDIFAKRERAARAKSLVAAILVIALVFLVGYFVFTWLATTMG